MEDLFYFTKATIKLEDIKKIATQIGYRCDHITRSYDYWLNIYYDHKSFWQWSELKKEDGDFDSFEPPQQKRISDTQPSSAFMIEYHIDSWSELTNFLKLLLEHYNGWIGYDDGNFEKTYTIENIEQLQHPFLDDSLL